ncbi:MAG: hypothetical protein KDH96_09640 [Candidatus Riesia sp.]|nr:hypothetical protein [Candidatus Riesia sp.]
MNKVTNIITSKHKRFHNKYKPDLRLLSRFNNEKIDGSIEIINGIYHNANKFCCMQGVASNLNKGKTLGDLLFNVTVLLQHVMAKNLSYQEQLKEIEKAFTTIHDFYKDNADDYNHVHDLDVLEYCVLLFNIIETAEITKSIF